ncbi:MAG: hypothetical protein R3C02_17070 [Planctomycetaceae bacterium]
MAGAGLTNGKEAPGNQATHSLLQTTPLGRLGSGEGDDRVPMLDRGGDFGLPAVQPRPPARRGNLQGGRVATVACQPGRRSRKRL